MGRGLDLYPLHHPDIDQSPREGKNSPQNRPQLGLKAPEQGKRPGRFFRGLLISGGRKHSWDLALSPPAEEEDILATQFHPFSTLPLG